MTDTDQSAIAAPPVSIEAFTFGEASPVLESRGFLDYLECWRNGRYFEPPVDLQGQSRTTRSNPYLHSGLTFKRNMLVRMFPPHRLLSREAFSQLALDYTTFGMGYVERRRPMSGAAYSLAGRWRSTCAVACSPVRCSSCERQMLIRRSTACRSGCQPYRPRC